MKIDKDITDNNSDKKVIIYTDGACSGNPGKGGWGAILIYNYIDNGVEKQYKKVISGGEKLTTNNKMELTAVINALQLLKMICNVEIFTDSKYVMEGSLKWLQNWKKNGWKGSNKKNVANIELWQKLDELLAKHNIIWHWVKGHNGDKLNEEVDKIARAEIDKI